jgi:hypothetical protein
MRVRLLLLAVALALPAPAAAAQPFRPIELDHARTYPPPASYDGRRVLYLRELLPQHAEAVILDTRTGVRTSWLLNPFCEPSALGGRQMLVDCHGSGDGATPPGWQVVSLADGSVHPVPHVKSWERLLDVGEHWTSGYDNSLDDPEPPFSINWRTGERVRGSVDLDAPGVRRPPRFRPRPVPYPRSEFRRRGRRIWHVVALSPRRVRYVRPCEDCPAFYLREGPWPIRHGVVAWIDDTRVSTFGARSGRRWSYRFRGVVRGAVHPPLRIELTRYALVIAVPVRRFGTLPWDTLIYTVPTAVLR